MIIRKCVIEDCREVYKLICYLEDTEFDYSTFQSIYPELISVPNNTYLVALEENKIIGFMSLEMNYKLHHNGRVGIIEEFVMDPNTRSKGYGKEFLAFAENYMKQQGCLCIELTSNFRRTRAHSFYEKNGFSKTSYKFFKDLT